MIKLLIRNISMHLQTICLHVCNYVDICSVALVMIFSSFNTCPCIRLDVSKQNCCTIFPQIELKSMTQTELKLCMIQHVKDK